MNIVKFYIDMEFNDTNVVDELFSNCKILLERLRSSEVQNKLAHCLINISTIWPLSI